MNASNDNNSSHPLGPMQPILFPVRTFSSPDGSQQTGIVSSAGNGNIEEKSVQWVGMTPLEMVENLASVTEQRESHHPNLEQKPLVVDTINLSSKTPAFPHEPNGTSTLTTPVIDTTVIEPVIQDGKKRQRLLTGFNVVSKPTYLPPWDPSLIIYERDTHALAIVNRLQFLARTLEAMPTYHQVISSYGRVRDHLSTTYEGIQNLYSFSPSIGMGANDTEKRMHLGYLFNETIQRMEALIDLAHRLASEKASACHVVPSNSFQPSDTHMPMQHNSAPIKPHNKKDFTEYMTNWLRDNWTNPYPDDDIMANLAMDCGTSPTVVSNWLINARTRKWRPAIVKAYDMGRPTDYLREDSINVFDGKPVRDLPDVEIIHSPPLAKGKRKSRK